MQNRLIAVIAAALLAGPYPLCAQDAAFIEAGEAVYKANCEGCHGEGVVSPGTAFDLRKLQANERPRFNNAMVEGKGQMPPWEGVLTPEQFDQVWAYIRSRAID